jgi:hypothetical protein
MPLPNRVTKARYWWALNCLFLFAASIGTAADPVFRYNTRDPGPDTDTVPILRAWKSIRLDPDYAGQWVVTGDLDGDGVAEIVSARNVDESDVHYTSAVCAQQLNGKVLWRWGDPTVGRKQLHHDVACQIYDWDGDGQREVVLLTDEFLVELDGRTGRERRRLPIPAQASDCLVFANLSGDEHASEVLLKTRYTQIWALDYNGKKLWTVRQPGGYRTAHQPRPVDLDADGTDEIVAGYSLLNADGTLRWTITSRSVDLSRGHLDTCRLLRRGDTLQEMRLVLTCCGANNLAMVDGNGRPCWEVSGHHFESLQFAEILPDVDGQEILVDIDHRPRGESPVWVVSERGEPLTQITGEYSRHHQLLDWTGDGISEIVVAQSRGLFNGRGERIGTFQIDPEFLDSDEILISVGDMTGDGLPDVTLSTLSAVFIFENPSPLPAHPDVPQGCGSNFTLY